MFYFFSFSIKQRLKASVSSQKYESWQCCDTEGDRADLGVRRQLSVTPTSVCVCVSLLSETSELVYCVADLQMSNQKLQEEVRKLKQVVEGMEDSNQKLAEENEELRTAARV